MQQSWEIFLSNFSNLNRTFACVVSYKEKTAFSWWIAKLFFCQRKEITRKTKPGLNFQTSKGLSVLFEDILFANKNFDIESAFDI